VYLSRNIEKTRGFAKGGEENAVLRCLVNVGYVREITTSNWNES